MAARFKKASRVRLVNEEEDNLLEDDLEEVVESSLSEGENESPRERERGASPQEESERHGSPEGDLYVWWRRGWRWLCCGKKQYHVRPSSKSVFCRVNSWKAVFIALFAFTMAMIISVLLSRLLREPDTSVSSPSQPGCPPTTQTTPTSNLSFVGAVSSDAAVCANMSAQILRQGGSAVDAAITTMLCNGVVHPESSGIGGGGFMVVREASGCVYVINFRESAPAKSTVNMFNSSEASASMGGLAVAVPGEIRGMGKAHTLSGRLEWKALFAPVIDLCRRGFEMTAHTVKAVNSSWEKLPRILQEQFTNRDGSRKGLGDLVWNLPLANTLEQIANYGADVFYKNSSISRNIVDTVQANGGIIDAEDLASYQAKVEEPLNATYNGHTFYVPPAPSGGPTLAFMLKLLDLFQMKLSSPLPLSYHLLVEVFKFAYSERTKLGDPHCGRGQDQQCVESQQIIQQALKDIANDSFVWETWSKISADQTFNVSYYHPDFSQTEDDGTSHISILSPDGSAVAVTTSVNTYFGSKVMTSTGIVLNNEMDDFSSPHVVNSYGLRPSKANFIFPGKRPLSSTCPTVAVTELKDGSSLPYMVVGASGGSRITTAVAQVILLASVYQLGIDSAIEKRRLHHQLLPDLLYYEDGFSEDILDYLETKGHELALLRSLSVVQGVLMDNHVTTAHADSRKQGTSVLVTY